MCDKEGTHAWSTIYPSHSLFAHFLCPLFSPKSAMHWMISTTITHTKILSWTSSFHPLFRSSMTYRLVTRSLIIIHCNLLSVNNSGGCNKGSSTSLSIVWLVFRVSRIFCLTKMVCSWGLPLSFLLFGPLFLSISVLWTLSWYRYSRPYAPAFQNQLLLK
jgi:hypothetical protein